MGNSHLLPAGFVLPQPPKPAGAYSPAVIHDNFIYLAGFGPRDTDGKPISGMIGRDLGLEEAQLAARNVGCMMLAVLEDALGSLDRVRRVVRVSGMILAAPDFVQHPVVLDGCSQLLVEVLGERGVHSRAAYGAASLPFGAPVSIDCVCGIET
jgi:enamine deaminase RidA (YjgF/YER057c/UK114 family)